MKVETTICAILLLAVEVLHAQDSHKVTGNAPVANFSAADTAFCISGVANFTDLSSNSPTSWKWYFPGATPNTSTAKNPTNIAYPATGLYSISLVATNGSGSDSVFKTNYIRVDTFPLSVTYTGATEICLGRSGTSLIVTETYKYAWEAPDTVFDAKPPATITFTLNLAPGTCIMDTTITIIVDTMPNVRVTGNLLCSGDSTILHAYGGYTYLWSTGATTNSIVGLLDSTYYVTVSKGACTKDSIKVTVTRCTGIQTISSQIAANIFPNPCGNNLFIDFENPSLVSDFQAEIQITDITGRVLFTYHCKPTTDHLSIDVSPLSPGMYFLRLNSSARISVKKFIKE